MWGQKERIIYLARWLWDPVPSTKSGLIAGKSTGPRFGLCVQKTWSNEVASMRCMRAMTQRRVGRLNRTSKCKHLPHPPHAIISPR